MVVYLYICMYIDGQIYVSSQQRTCTQICTHQSTYKHRQTLTDTDRHRQTNRIQVDVMFLLYKLITCHHNTHTRTHTRLLTHTHLRQDKHTSIRHKTEERKQKGLHVNTLIQFSLRGLFEKHPLPSCAASTYECSYQA